MARLEMNPTDMGELYVLLYMYIQTYGAGGRDLKLLHEIEERYIAQYGKHSKENEQPKITNARGAGRKPLRETELIEQICDLYKEGKSIRKISEQVKHSVGYVHKIIHEQHINRHICS